MNIKNGLIYLLSLVVVAVASSLITQKLNVNGGLSDQSVYLIGSATVTDAKRLPEYQKVSGPLAALSGGYVPLAFSKPNMIEGKLPAPGGFFIERYDSLEGLNRFINSPEFQEAKIMRDEVADVHFMMWLPAIPKGSLPH
jgi:uncharacterized protein (DUF1330 family)